VRAEDEPTYDVAFSSKDLWPNGAEAALVHVGVFQSYLERVQRPRRQARKEILEGRQAFWIATARELR